MSRAIFRQAALDRLGSPEQLDDLVQLSMPWRWDPRAQVRRLADGRGWRRSRGLQPQRVKTPTVLQMEATECGAAALGSVLAFHGRSVPLEQLRVECGVSRDGSKASNMIKAARDHGLLAKGFTKDPAGLATLPLPLIVFWNFNHFVVVEGFGAQRVYLNDPASGPRVVSAEEFDAGFTGVVLVFVPGPEFVRTTRDSQYSLPGALRQNLRGSEWALALLLLASLAMAAPGLLLPVLTGMFVDNVLIQRSYGEVGRLLTGLALVGLVQVALTFGQGSILVWLDNRLSTSTSHQFFRHLLRLPIGFFTQRYAGEIAGRVALNDRVARLLTGDLATAALSGLLVVAYVVLMARFDLLLAVIGTGGAVINLAVVRASSRRRLDGQHRLQQDHGKLMGATFATLQMIDTVKATGAESDAFARWAGHHARVVNAEHAMALANQVMSVVPRLITGLTVTATLVLGGVRVMNGDLSAGTLVAFQGLLLGFFQPFNQLMALSSALQEATAGRLRIDDVLRAPADPLLERSAASTAGPESDVRLRGPVALRGVTFGYSPRGPALIKDFDLTIPVAGWVALVGSSASGKSTVARLVAGLYQPWSGEILFDGLPVAEVARSVLTRSLAMVDQDVTLFAGSIRDNLTLWDDSVGPEELDRAARDAEIHADILALDGGYDAVLVEQGRNLSGGQRQRLAIARALVRNPTILVLDEATSALDPVTEQRVMDNLRRRGCQCLIVAHRLSTIRDADQILVLEDGEVVEQGTHASLTHAGGAYARLIAAEPVSTLTGAQAANGRPDSHQPALDGSGATATLAPSVLHAETRAVPESDERATDGDVCLLAACRLVGDALGIVVRSSPVPSGGDPLANISRASRVRTRQVLLRDGWWRADCGPLLGYTAQDRTPVALLPAAAGPYSLADPCTGVSTSITAESATSLSPAAVMFYRPLPERIVSAWDLLRLGISGGRRDVARLLVAGAIGGLLALATPVAIGYLFDLILPTGQWPLLMSMGLVLSAATLAVAAFAVAENIALVRMNGRTDAVTQAAVWDRVLRLPPTSFGKFEIGDLGQRAMGIATIRQVVSDSAIVAVLAAIFSVFSLGLLVVYDAWLALVALGLVLVFAVTTGVMGRRALDYQRRIGAAQGRLAGLAVQLIGGITQLRTAGAELRAYGRWAALFGAHKRLALQAGRERSLLSAWDAGFPALALVILYMLVALGGTVDLSTGSLIAFTAAFAQFMAAAIGLSVSIMSLVSVVPLYERMRPILETAPEVHVTGLHPGELGGAIKLDHVTFRYHTAGPVVLDDVSLEINPGECVALVGPSGSGKSTLLRLLLGFERPDVGTILYDGRPLHTLDVQAVRRQLGVVLQNGSVTADDIYHNIVGSAPLGVDAAWQAATMAGLDAEIRALPMGMYTLVSEGGTTFSAGQRQRLSIARALVARPRVVLFDEATSALDNATQLVVSQSLADLQATRVLVAHRLSTVMHADRIVVLRAGRIVQSGQYDELMQADGLFAELARQQVV